MAVIKQDTPTNVKSNAVNKAKAQDVSLKGTFVSVMLLGVFLLLCWVGAFVLFLSRN